MNNHSCEYKDVGKYLKCSIQQFTDSRYKIKAAQLIDEIILSEVKQLTLLLVQYDLTLGILHIPVTHL